MAINGGPVEATFVVGGQNKGSPNAVNDVTYVSKPGLVASPLADKKCIDLDSSVFIDSFNESYRDYGLEDLCSDSDNTDDENQPNKRVSYGFFIVGKKYTERNSQASRRYSETIYAIGNIDSFGACDQSRRASSPRWSLPRGQKSGRISVKSS